MAKLIELGVVGAGAGALNAGAGGGSLLTFPALVALGLPSLTANLSNSVAQVGGNVAIVRGYRPELAGQRRRFERLLPAALLGAGGGIAALELASAHSFRVISPALVLLACVLLAVQPRVTRLLAANGRRSARPPGVRRTEAHPGLPRLDAGAGLHVSVAIACAYATYFGAAAGVLLLAVLAVFVLDGIQRLNALNRLLILVVSVLSAVLFVVLGPVSWPAIAVLAPTTAIGGRAGVALVRRLSPTMLRTLMLLIGAAAASYLIAVSW